MNRNQLVSSGAQRQQLNLDPLETRLLKARTLRADYLRGLILRLARTAGLKGGTRAGAKQSATGAGPLTAPRPCHGC